jgi:hypothetical protein
MQLVLLPNAWIASRMQSCVVIDDVAGWGGAMNLDHHVGNRTPPEFKAPLATNIVLNAIRAGELPSSFKWVTIRHFDTDGCLATWCALNPSHALERSEFLSQAAAWGDFYEGEYDSGSGRCAFGLSMLLQETLPRSFSVGKTLDLLKRGHSLVSSIVDLPENYNGHWREVTQQFEADRAAIVARPPMRVGHVSVVESDRQLSLASILACDKAPVFVLIKLRKSRAYDYDIFVRPRFGWRYCPTCIGPVPISDLSQLRRRLARIEGKVSNRSKWRSVSFDGNNVWWVGTAVPSILAPSTVVDAANQACIENAGAKDECSVPRR